MFRICRVLPLLCGQLYGGIVAPLTTLLKRNGFFYMGEVKEVFVRLKKMVVTLPILELLNFS